MQMSIEHRWSYMSPRKYGLHGRRRSIAVRGRSRRKRVGQTGYPHRKSPVPHQRPGFGRSDCRVEVTRPGFPLTTHSYRHSVPRMYNVVTRLLTDSSHHIAQARLRLVVVRVRPFLWSKSEPQDSRRARTSGRHRRVRSPDSHLLAKIRREHDRNRI
jgi:hypothetical protein